MSLFRKKVEAETPSSVSAPVLTRTRDYEVKIIRKYISPVQNSITEGSIVTTYVWSTRDYPEDYCDKMSTACLNAFLKGDTFECKVLTGYENYPGVSFRVERLENLKLPEGVVSSGRSVFRNIKTKEF